MASRDLPFGSERAENPSQDSDETQDMATSTPRREAETTFAPPDHPQPRGQFVVEDTTTSRVQQQTPDAMTALATSLHNLLQQFTTQVTRMNTRRERPTQTYSGLLYENPTAFVEYLEGFFADNGVVEDHHKIEVFRGQLKDAARKWAQAYENLPISYPAFRESFLRRYDSDHDRSGAIAILYGENQKEGESVEVFITRKRSLFARLNPNIEEPMMAQVIVDQLLPPIRSKLRGRRFHDILELAHYAEQAESDSKDEAVYWERRCAAAQRAPTSPPPRAMTTQRPPQPSPVRTTRIQAPAPPPTKTSNRPPTPIRPTGPQTPCRFCQQWHYHRDCPYNPYRGDLNVQRATEVQPPRSSVAQPRPHPRQQPQLQSRLRQQPQQQPPTTIARRNPSSEITVVAEVHAEAEPSEGPTSRAEWRNEHQPLGPGTSPSRQNPRTPA